MVAAGIPTRVLGPGPNAHSLCLVPRIDKDGNGYLNRDEIGQALEELRIVPDLMTKDEATTAIMLLADTNKDGKLSLEEFKVSNNIASAALGFDRKLTLALPVPCSSNMRSTR